MSDSRDDRHIGDSGSVHGGRTGPERAVRLLAAAEAKTAGYGGITATSLATGMAHSTIGRGLNDLAAPDTLVGDVRRPGGGGPTLIEKDPTLLENLRHLVEPVTMGDPMRPLMWVSKSHAKLAAALRGMGHKAAIRSVPPSCRGGALPNVLLK